jgi:hypothetical protein
VSINIPMSQVLLDQQVLSEAKPLVGFDYGNHLYHVLLFPIGKDGGAIGVWRDGSNFCARITLDALAAFAEQAQANSNTSTQTAQ